MTVTTTKTKKKAFEIRNLADREAEVFLYGEIAWDVDASEFVRELSLLDVDVIRLRVNSPGGDAYQGIAMMNALQTHPARVETTVEGMAFSAASFIVAGGSDHVTIYPGAEVMIHDALVSTYGNADDMGRAIERLDRMSNSIAEIYARRAGGDPEDWRAAMRAETWFTAQEAVDAGLADEVWEPEESTDSGRDPVAAVSNDFALLNRFRGRQAPPPRELMNNLTDDTKENKMDFKEAIANKLGVKSEDLTEEQVLEALDEVLAEQHEEAPAEPEENEAETEENETEAPTEDDGDEEEAPGPDTEEVPEPTRVANLETVTLDMDTYNELKNAAAAGHELAQRRADEDLAAEVDRWVAEGRISNALRARALEAMRADADQARRVFGSNPVNTIPRREVGSSSAQEVQPVRNSSRPRPGRSDDDKQGGGREYNAPYRGFASRPRLTSNQA